MESFLRVLFPRAWTYEDDIEEGDTPEDEADSSLQFYGSAQSLAKAYHNNLDEMRRHDQDLQSRGIIKRDYSAQNLADIIRQQTDPWSKELVRRHDMINSILAADPKLSWEFLEIMR